jgi:hypothetical protein
MKNMDMAQMWHSLYHAQLLGRESPSDMHTLESDVFV